jgi:DNA primase
MADVVDDIKSRLGIEEVVSQYVQLKKFGRNLKGLCPFHGEKTPSFVVSPEKQICHCFGCNKGGDIFAFIQEIEGVTFVESMQILADRCGIKIDEDKIEKKAAKSEKDIYFKAHDLACEFFEQQLCTTSDGKKVLEYLYRRGLKDETIKEFRIGFAPDKYDELYPTLLNKGIPKDVLIKSGLVSAKNLATEDVYDKYRARLMFPIIDAVGRVCGFGGRALKHDQAPKYLNSPENPVYNKSRVLYGLHHSKKFIKEENKIVLVEGYFDVILPYQAGIRNLVASSGTALSNEQVRMIKRLTTNVVTCFDTDSAGMEATRRAYVLFQNEDIQVKTVMGIDKKDPADYVLEHGDKFKELVDKAGDFISFMIAKVIGENDVTSMTGRRKVVKELLPYYQGMSPTTRDFCVKELSERLGLNEKHLYEEIESYKLPSDHPMRQAAENSDTKAVANKLSTEELIIGLILENPNLFENANKVLDLGIVTEWTKNVYNDLLQQYNSARENFKNWNFEIGFLSQDKAKIDVLRLYAEELYNGFSHEALGVEVEKLVDRFKKDRKVKNLNELQISIAEAEKADNREQLNKLLLEQQNLLKS